MMADDSWRDSYDDWKLASPYDEHDEPCDHENYDIDILDGRATCDRCGERWYASNEEVLQTIDHMAWYAEYEERENRKQWWRDIWHSIKSIIPRRKRLAHIDDDDIPF
jgi:hypothetical protein